MAAIQLEMNPQESAKDVIDKEFMEIADSTLPVVEIDPDTYRDHKRQQR